MSTDFHDDRSNPLEGLQSVNYNNVEAFIVLYMPMLPGKIKRGVSVPGLVRFATHLGEARPTLA